MAPRDEDYASGDDLPVKKKKKAEIDEEEEGEVDVVERQRHKRHKKLKMGDKSGLTEDDRRQLRRDQRNLAKALQEGPMEDEDDGDFVDRVRKKNNDLFENVAYTREAVLDGENVLSIAERFSKKVDDMVHVPRYDVNRMIGKLKSKLTGRHSETGSTYFDWRVLGTEAGVCFNSLPSRVTFLLGPLENGRIPEKKVRVARQKKSDMVEEKLVEQKPEEQTQQEKQSGDQLSQAEQDLRNMRKVLKKRVKATWEENKRKYEEIKASQPDLAVEALQEFKERGSDIEFVPFLINPKSFTQTVENIFNFSFLIKKGEARIDMRMATPLGDSQQSVLGLDTSGCFISAGDPQGYEGPSKQCVIPFTMKDWRRLVEAYDLEKCDVPHRKSSKQLKSATHSQHSSQEDD